MFSSSPAQTKQQEQFDQRPAARGWMEKFTQWEALTDWEWEPLLPRDKPRGGRVKERGGVWEEMEGVVWSGLVWSGTLGPQAGTQERKCSRECNLLKWNERHARVPCVSSRGEMIDWERLEERGGEMAPGRATVGIYKIYPLCFCLCWQ